MAAEQTHPPIPQADCLDTIERLSIALETAAVGMWEWMPERNTLFFDDRYYTMAGYTLGDFPASIEGWGERVHPEDLQDVREGLYQLARGEMDTNQREFRFKTGSGEWIWILGRGRVFQRNAAGRPTRIIGTHIDITDLRKAESESRRIHAHFERVLEKSHAGVLIAQDGIIRFANPSLTGMTGYAVHELADRPLVDIIHPTDRDMVMDRHVRRLRGESLPEYYTLRCIRKDGTALWLEMNTIIFEWLDRPAILCFLRDVTFTKTMERQILQAQKMQAIGTLAGGIAHDFNNIVSAIMGNTEICLMEAPEGSRTAKRLRQVIQASQRAGELVNQILAFSRQEESDQKPINPAVIVKEVMKLIRASIPASVILEKRIEGDTGPVMADPTRIHQVVIKRNESVSGRFPDRLPPITELMSVMAQRSFSPVNRG